MVFPSRGCQTCRKRRVKCDGGEPTCSRCEKGSRTCTWDPSHHAGLLYRSENAFAQGKPRRPRASKEVTSDPETVAGPESSEISTALSTPIDIQAFHYWADNFVFHLDDMPDIGREYSSYVLFHWNRAQPGSSIHLALSALSLAIFGKAKHVNTATEDAEKYHALTIVKAKEEMKEPSNGNIDQLLLAIMLMGFYENIIFRNKNTSAGGSPSGGDEVGSQFWKDVCHHKGASGLLKLRRQEGYLPNMPLDRAVRRQLVRTVILRGVTIPEWIVNGEEYGEVSPALEIDSLMIRVAGLRAQSLTFFSDLAAGIARNPHDLKTIAGDADALDTTLVLWSKILPQDWKFAIQQSPPSEFLFEGTSHIYTSHGHAAVWNRYRAVRLIVNSICIRSLSYLLQCPSQRLFILSQQATCQENLASLATDLCRSAPFFFRTRNANGSTGNEISPKMAVLLAWPLAVAIRTEGVPEPQRQWLKGKLKIAADSMGDAMLNAVIANNEFKF